MVITDNHNDIDDVKEARTLYESELKKLLETNVSNHIIEKPVTVRRPVIVELGEIDTEETELIYEEEYDGEIPCVLVGCNFQRETYRGIRKLIRPIIHCHCGCMCCGSSQRDFSRKTWHRPEKY